MLYPIVMLVHSVGNLVNKRVEKKRSCWGPKRKATWKRIQRGLAAAGRQGIAGNASWLTFTSRYFVHFCKIDEKKIGRRPGIEDPLSRILSGQTSHADPR